MTKKSPSLLKQSAVIVATAWTTTFTIFADEPRVKDDAASERRWLENMIWHHRFNTEEIAAATGWRSDAIEAMIERFNIRDDNRPPARVDPVITILPYPGGRHPRIGFLDGAIDPLRGTKLSVFTPWDPLSYVVLDVPEALWSNLGLTFLAHTHVETLWTKQGMTIPDQDWLVEDGGELTSNWKLPNGIEFQVVATPHRDHLALKMALTNRTSQKLTDLRVQMCAMLKGARGFEQQTNDNKIFRDHLAACRDVSGNRWVIFGWQPIHRTWGNAPCPCLHADPRIPDCEPGETHTVYGWFSFYQGPDIEGELHRIESTWKPTDERTVALEVRDFDSRALIPCRVSIRNQEGRWFFAEADPQLGQSKVVRYEKQNWINARSQEFHSCISAAPVQLRLTPGMYTLRLDRGKEYFPREIELAVDDSEMQPPLTVLLRRWIDMKQLGWFSADTHVHRPIRELAIPMLADDVNLAFPMVYWTTRSDQTAAMGDRTDRDDTELPPELIRLDDDHYIWPKNTEWEIFSVGPHRHTLGAILALNHQSPFAVAVPPIRSIAEQADREGALLDLEKHDWPFSMMIPPLLENSLGYELANNHMWQTDFAFSTWSTPPPDWMEVGNGLNGGEKEWMEFTHRTYWCLLNCGFRIFPTAGTATGVHPVPVGFGRVYVQVPGGWDYRRWIEGLRAGRSFVTTGPMLFADIDPQGNHSRCKVHADNRVDSIEWIVDGSIVPGEILDEIEQSDGSFQVRAELRSSLAKAHWVAVRAWQRSDSGKWRFAHSAPVWLENQLPPQPRPREVQFLIDRTKAEIERSRNVLSPEAMQEYDQVLKYFEKLLKSVAAAP